MAFYLSFPQNSFTSKALMWGNILFTTVFILHFMFKSFRCYIIHQRNKIQNSNITRNFWHRCCFLHQLLSLHHRSVPRLLLYLAIILIMKLSVDVCPRSNKVNCRHKSVHHTIQFCCLCTHYLCRK